MQDNVFEELNTLYLTEAEEAEDATEEFTPEQYADTTCMIIMGLIISGIREIGSKRDFIWDEIKATKEGEFLLAAISTLKAINESKFEVAMTEFAETLGKESKHLPEEEIKKFIADAQPMKLDTQDLDVVFYSFLMATVEAAYETTFGTKKLHTKPLKEGVGTEDVITTEMAATANVLQEGAFGDWLEAIKQAGGWQKYLAQYIGFWSWPISILTGLAAVGIVAAPTIGIFTVGMGISAGMFAGFPSAMKAYKAAGENVHKGAAEVLKSLGEALKALAGAIDTASKIMLAGWHVVQGVTNTAVKTFDELKTVLDHAIDQIDNVGTEVIDAVKDITTLTWNNLKMIGADAYNTVIVKVYTLKTKTGVKKQLKIKQQLAKACPSASLEDIDRLYDTIEDKKITPRDSQMALELYNKKRELVKQTIELDQLAKAETDRKAAADKAKQAKKDADKTDAPDKADKKDKKNKKDKVDKLDTVEVVDKEEEPAKIGTDSITQIGMQPVENTSDTPEIIDVESSEPAVERSVSQNMALLASLDTPEGSTALLEKYTETDLVNDAGITAAGIGAGAGIGGALSGAGIGTAAGGLIGAGVGAGLGIIVALVKGIIKKAKENKEKKIALEHDAELQKQIADLKSQIGEKKAEVAIDQIKQTFNLGPQLSMQESLTEEDAFNLTFEDRNAFGELLHEGKEIDGKCCICGEEILGYGNNAEPYAHGRCCDACNAKFVLPARIEEIKINKEEK